MAEGGVENAINYCNANASNLMDSLNKYYNVTIRRTSDKIRNGENSPTKEEQKVLANYTNGGEMKRITGVFTMLLLLVTNAEAIDIGIGAKAGTIGAGFEVSVPLTKTINARVSLTTIDIDDQEENINIGKILDNDE